MNIGLDMSYKGLLWFGIINEITLPAAPGVLSREILIREVVVMRR